MKNKLPFISAIVVLLLLCTGCPPEKSQGNTVDDSTTDPSLGSPVCQYAYSLDTLMGNGTSLYCYLDTTKDALQVRKLVNASGGGMTILVIDQIIDPTDTLETYSPNLCQRWIFKDTITTFEGQQLTLDFCNVEKQIGVHDQQKGKSTCLGWVNIGAQNCDYCLEKSKKRKKDGTVVEQLHVTTPAALLNQINPCFLGLVDSCQQKVSRP